MRRERDLDESDADRRESLGVRDEEPPYPIALQRLFRVTFPPTADLGCRAEPEVGANKPGDRSDADVELEEVVCQLDQAKPRARGTISLFAFRFLEDRKIARLERRFGVDLVEIRKERRNDILR